MLQGTFSNIWRHFCYKLEQGRETAIGISVWRPGIHPTMERIALHDKSLSCPKCQSRWSWGMFYDIWNVNSIQDSLLYSQYLDLHVSHTYLLNKEIKKNSHIVILVFIPNTQTSYFSSLDYSVSSYYSCFPYAPWDCILFIFTQRGTSEYQGLNKSLLYKSSLKCISKSNQLTRIFGKFC